MSLSPSASLPLISVIIPCYNHGRFLSKAIDSVLKQSYRHHEIIVVDDGSTDDTKVVAGRYAEVKYIYQFNQGLSAARNTGIDNSTGQYLVFLDSDDWLFDDALQINLQYLLQKKEAGFVSGAYTVLSDRGSAEIKKSVEEDHYCNLLRGNYISMHAAVMYQRRVFNNLRYDTTLRACEDYDIYLKIARKETVIIHHTRQIAVYYHHDSNMSGNMPVMLESALKVLSRQKEFLKNETEKECLRQGMEHWKNHYSLNIYSKLVQVPASNNNKNREQEVSALRTHQRNLYYKYRLVKVLSPIRQVIFKIGPPFILRWIHKAGLYKRFVPAPGKINMGDFDRTTPYSDHFGYDRGGPVDRYYIENFLQKQAHHVHGRVLEIGDNEYTLKYGGSKVDKSDILHVEEGNAKATIVGDLSNAPQLPDNCFDCIILTQTLHLIYEYKEALRTCYRILKPGGVLLMTVPGISHIDQGEWKNKWLWSFTESSIIKLFEETFLGADSSVEVFGNVLVATAFLYGLGLPELKKEQMDKVDEHYQVIITVSAKKPAYHTPASGTLYQ